MGRVLARPPRHGEVELSGQDVVPALTGMSTVTQWFARPEAQAWLRGQLVESEFARMLDDPALGEMFRAIPLVRLTRRPGFPVSEDEAAEAAGRFSG